MENAVFRNPDLLPTYSPKLKNLREKVVLSGYWKGAIEKF
jgi:hypothetical protein